MVSVMVRVRVSVKVRLSFSIIGVEGERRNFLCITLLSWCEQSERYFMDRKIP